MNNNQKNLLIDYILKTYKELNKIVFENKEVSEIDKKQNELLKSKFDNLEGLIEEIIKAGK